MTFASVKRRCLSISLMSLTWLTGCQTPISSTSMAPSNPTDVTRQHPSEHLSHWSLQGIIGVRQPKKAWSAHVSWNQQDQTHYDLRFYGPMGGGTTMIQRQGGQVILKDARTTAQARDAQSLLRHQTGMNVPVESLYYWVRGIPAPGRIDFKQLNADQTYAELNQSGYTIRYSDYQFVNGYHLPTKMLLQGRNFSLKFIIKSWNLS